MNVNLYTTDDQFETAHDRLHKTRTSSRFVRVEREALENLLMDYSSMLNQLQERSTKIVKAS